MTKLIRLADPDTLKDSLQFLFGCGELYPLTNQRTFIVFAKIGDIRFKVSI